MANAAPCLAPRRDACAASATRPYRVWAAKLTVRFLTKKSGTAGRARGGMRMLRHTRAPAGFPCRRRVTSHVLKEIRMKLRTTVLAASLLFGTAAFAQTQPAQNAGLAAPAAVTATGAAAQANGKERVEKHIKQLHDQLKITPAEEAQWAVVAQTMRDNAMEIDRLIAKREQRAAMTALEDLDSYAQIMQANSDGVKKLAAVFAPLYNAMPDEQKRNADKVFAESHERRAAHHGKNGPNKGTTAPGKTAPSSSNG
ncbi:hypothetical protein CAL13_11790 [Bordetella genomosp. 9]|uniref:LTXXQ motif family protein n=2 Tax=Bordetella genomosp. 9 TaxID=1416803 RepID=A0A1W6Z0C5_9BORD|nr:hypothetical protein CAL13_11790 [Bordetella genomosp. 9]